MELEKRESLSIGIKEIIGTIVTGSILVYVGMYATSKTSGSLDPINGGTYINSTHYCSSPGVWNTTHCIGGLNTTYDSGWYTTYNSVKANSNSGFDLSSVLFIVLAAAGIVGVVLMVFS